MSWRSREFRSDGDRWRAVEAWRALGGWGLVYFLPLEADDGAEATPAGDDRLDRRAALEPGETLEALEAGELEERLEAATPLTDTERRFRAPDGRLWLAQSVGPVWAEGGVAGGLTGTLFTSLEGEPRRLRGPGEHVGRADRRQLAGWWRSASEADDGEGTRPPSRPSAPRPDP